MERNPDAIFWIALGLVLGVVLLAAALGPRGDEEVRLGGRPENPPQEARVAQSREAPEDFSPQPAPQESSSQPAPQEDSSSQPAPQEDSSSQLAPQDTSAQPAPAVPSAQQSPVLEPPPH